MKRADNNWLLMVAALAGLAAGTTGCAQGSYSQPGYDQPGYGQYPNSQPGYPGYGNQPGYNQPGYNQPGYNQPGYGYGNQPGTQSQDFYNDLAPYGQWVQTPEYGTVWIPRAEQGFQPYASNGHWVVTEYGNTWVSDYAWGWAPFHYGRWYQDPRMGWAWVPGSDWGPAWVSWRSGGGYYGWAPLGPGININVNINIPANYWVFVPQTYISSPRLFDYYVPRPRVVNIYQNTTIINNVYRANDRAYAYGPRRDEIERVTRQRVPVYQIENNTRPGRDRVGDNSVGFYRPDLNRGRGGSNTYNGDFNNGRGNAGGGSYNNGGNAYPGGRANTGGNYNGGRDYSRDNGAGAGTYSGGTTRQNPASPNPGFPQRTESGRGAGRPNYEAQQNQPLPPASQPSAQPDRQNSPWGGQRAGGQRGGSYGEGRQRGAEQGSMGQPQEPRAGGNEPRGQAVPQQSQQQAGGQQPVGSQPGVPQQEGYNSGRGSSRGPR